MARKRSHQPHVNPSRPRFWGKHAVAAALDNPQRKVLKAWATREAAGFMQFPKELPVTLADVADLGRLVPNDAPHQGVVVEAEPLPDIWLGDILADAPERAVLLVLDQVTDPHNVGA
ncbi:MAG: RNA methyltransferase substrate-binding domain-containing protein, partial [Sphingomicrobium sp.]